MPTESVKVDTDLMDQCRAIAKKEERSLKAVVGKLIRRALNSRKGE